MELTKGYALDQKLMEKGKVFEIDGATFQLRYLGSETGKKAVADLPENLKKLTSGNIEDELDVSQEELDSFFAEMFANALLVNWEGVTERGKNINATPANIRRIIKKYDVLREKLWDRATDQRNYLLFENFEEDAKN